MSAAKGMFPGMHADEVVILLQRRHWSLLFGKMFRWFVLILLPIAIIVVMNIMDAGPSFDEQSAGGTAIILGVSAYVLIVLLLFFQDWLDYYLDALILSSERIVHIEQKSVFNREVSHVTLDRIQDVSIETKGVLSTLFGFGTISIETAGEQENFVINHVPDVEKLQSAILMYAKKAPRMGIEHAPAPKEPQDGAPKGPTAGTTGTP